MPSVGSILTPLWKHRFAQQRWSTGWGGWIGHWDELVLVLAGVHQCQTDEQRYEQKAEAEYQCVQRIIISQVHEVGGNQGRFDQGNSQRNPDLKRPSRELRGRDGDNGQHN